MATDRWASRRQVALSWRQQEEVISRLITKLEPQLDLTTRQLTLGKSFRQPQLAGVGVYFLHLRSSLRTPLAANTSSALASAGFHGGQPSHGPRHPHGRRIHDTKTVCGVLGLG